MVSLTALWLPIVVAAVIVFVASALSHMVLKLHKNDYSQLPAEADVLAAMRQAGVGVGNYHFPYCADMKEMGSPEMLKKLGEGPVGLMHVFPSGPPAMGKYLVRWFVFCLVVGVFAAYLAGRTLAPGTDYLAVFQVAGTAAFLAYGLGELVNWIWRGQSAGTTVKAMVEGLVYGLLTGGVFGWLWPAA